MRSVHVVNESYEHNEQRRKRALKIGLPVVLFGLICLVISLGSKSLKSEEIVMGTIFSGIIILVGLGILKG